jgi:hypothetical protein
LIKNRSRCWVLGLFLAFALEPTRCGVQPVASEAAQIPPAIIITEGRTDQGYPYVFGGVSSNEREVLEARAKDFNLMLVFAQTSGPYLSDVQLRLASAKIGHILAFTVDGPWFYIQLPSGAYDVTATFNGQARQVRNLRVTRDKLIKQTIVWHVGEKPEP